MTRAKKKRPRITLAKPKTTRAKRAATTVPEPPPSTVLVLRTCPADMIAIGTMDGVSWSFTWPRLGPVECPDWDPKPVYGYGLHGLLWGDGDWSLLSADADAVWMVVSVAAADIVSFGSKIKFPRGVVVFAGAKADAIALILAGAEAMTEAQRTAREWEDRCGTNSKAASSGAYSTAASSGAGSTAASSGANSKAASSGAYSTAASSGEGSKAAAEGSSCIAATIGNDGRAKAGLNGLLIVTYWVDAEKRYRACVGSVGEDGILADTWYRVRGGKLVVA